MHLAFVYFDNTNPNFRKDLIRYNTLLKSYFNTEDASIIKKLNETFGSLLKNSTNYEVLSEKETEVYNVIIDFMANDLNEQELEKVQGQVYDDDLKGKVVEKMSRELPNIDPVVLQGVMEKSNEMLSKGNSQNIEIVFVPSAVQVEQ